MKTETKIIDILIKIANNEEVPKKIKYQDKIWEYKEYNSDYKNEDIYLFEYLFKRLNTKYFINYGVEIIEEDKKIEHCKGYEDFDCMDEIIEHLREKIDTLIDEVNKMKEEK